MTLMVVLALTLGQDGGSLRVRAVGDVMLGTSVPEGFLPPDDGATLLAEVTPWLADADLTFANLEGPLCDSGSSTKCRRGGSCYAFRSPTRYARYLTAAGVDLASTANNHSGDFGEACRRETERALDAAGIAWSGPPGSIASVTVRGQKVALVAFHTSGATNDVNDVATARRLVAQAASTHDLVFVSFHGGAEGLGADRVRDGKERYLGENRGDLKAFAHAVVDAGADLVLGHGPHVLRGMEVYKGRLVAYSLGNFATYGRFSLGGALGVSVILEVELAGDGSFLTGRLLSTRQEGKGVPKPDEDRRGQRAIAALSARDFQKTAVRVAPDGTLSAR
ncbi:MAG: CapA family protein [Myxococcaceae bacterium]|jgi:poly-gamma-glutamate capsule biosynthesis protein CapA/YwtB (metallophosphatase superfamily)|nr:CapA family protein [Myxococcaceae bacterium]MCA3014308.1 CapA family protein [Myxococcaceae bacterium]